MHACRDAAADAHSLSSQDKGRRLRCRGSGRSSGRTARRAGCTRPLTVEDGTGLEDAADKRSARIATFGLQRIRAGFDFSGVCPGIDLRACPVLRSAAGVAGRSEGAVRVPVAIAVAFVQLLDALGNVQGSSSRRTPETECQTCHDDRQGQPRCNEHTRKREGGPANGRNWQSPRTSAGRERRALIHDVSFHGQPFGRRIDGCSCDRLDCYAPSEDRRFSRW